MRTFGKVTGENILNKMHEVFSKSCINCKKCTAMCTDGAKSGKAKLRREIPHTKAVVSTPRKRPASMGPFSKTPQLRKCATFFVYLMGLLEHKIMTFLKNNCLKFSCLKTICQKTNVFESWLYCTDVSWLSWGKESLRMYLS